MNRRIRLTDISVRALKCSEDQTTYWDETLPAFGVRVGRRAKTFLVVRDSGRRITIGRYPETVLSDARKEAKRILALSAAPHAISISPTTLNAVTLFIETRAQRNRPASIAETQRIFRNHLLPHIGAVPVAEVTTHQLTRIFDELMDTPIMANKVFTAARTFFNWAVARRYIHYSPLTGLPLPNKPRSRSRVLTDAELVAIYRAASDMGHPFGYLVLVCIHTGMRRGEVATLRWEHISPDYITIPGTLTKNGQQHIMPNLINDNLKLIPKSSPYLFPSDAGTPFSAWSKNKSRIDKRSGVTSWVIHDLRRTFSTKMAEWQLAQPHVIERLLNHTTGTMSPLALVYNRATYLAEMRDALQKYENKLAQLLAS